VKRIALLILAAAFLMGIVACESKTYVSTHETKVYKSEPVEVP